ncbi:MAG: hypothetical protein AVDCRST_MAG25-901 [uncultured Rubrobacteraceae bacterium]|uniref:Uncharacterized protein n=1 Tax=uncultured Rubrobacteraceae bacterium TaxID=349277 RepID=A0A6J4RBU6_9ACTN|nr:MAG: hypothetical protein AVDCRST_MAG25-901 [uncultured Rubrobacteraceae bacterium]
MGEGFGLMGRLRLPTLARVPVRGVEDPASRESARPEKARSVERGEE